ncbi:MAG: NAD(P)-binding domain-containing protein [Crocinitomicaceae bacterium]|nr:NAD(P)-binding domain-containing protein [Crocinitomicaceae bacterium]
MKIAIIGLGWLGNPLAKELMNRGHEVCGSVSSEAKLDEMSESSLTVFKYSTNSKDKIPTSIASSTEVLLLMVPPNKDKASDEYGKQLVAITKQFKSLKRVVFTSSTGIYPKQYGIYREDFEFLENEKGSTLYRAEKALENECGDQLIITRLAGLFGPKRHPVLQLQGQEYVKNPYGIINLVHQKDVIKAIYTLLDANKSGVYNVVAPEHPYRKDYYTKLFRYYNLKPIGFEDTPWIERKISTAKLMSELDFHYDFSINDVKDCLG